ncbi:ABC transporter C-terminal domain-containing protein [Verrucomicrobiota bacterium]
MTPPGITRYSGGYDYYCEKIEAKSDQHDKTQKPEPSTTLHEPGKKNQTTKKPIEIRRDLQKKIKHTEKQIEKHEQEQKRLIEEMARKDADYKEINKSLAVAQQKINDYTCRWEALSIELDKQN